MSVIWIFFVVLGLSLSGGALYYLSRYRKQQIEAASEECRSRLAEVEQTFSLAAPPVVPPIPEIPEILLKRPSSNEPVELGLSWEQITPGKDQAEDELKSALIAELRNAGYEVQNPHASEHYGPVVAIKDGFVVLRPGRETFKVSIFPLDQLKLSDCKVGDRLNIKSKCGRWIAESTRDDRSRGGNAR